MTIRADTESTTDAAQPIGSRIISEYKPGHISGTEMQGAANAVAEWIADGAGEMYSLTVHTDDIDPIHVDEDIVILPVSPDDWDVCASETDAHRDAINAMRAAHNHVARKHGASTAASDMMIIPRSEIPEK